MPRAKRPLEEIDGSNRPQPPKSRKKTGKGTANVQEQENQNAPEASSGKKDKQKAKASDDTASEKTLWHELAPHEYVCMDRPLWDVESEHISKAKVAGEVYEFEDARKECDELTKSTDAFSIPLSDRPGYPWVVLRKSLLLFLDTMREATYCVPRHFDMYVYNDFEGYGLMQLVENLLIAYNVEFKKKEQNLKAMWVPLAALAHFALAHELAQFKHIDDGARLNETLSLMGTAILSALNALERAGELNPDSSFKDIGIVVAMYIEIADVFEAGSTVEDDEDDWRANLCAYVETRRIDVTTVFGSEKEILAAFGGDQDELEAVLEEWPDEGVDRWSFARKFKRHEAMYGTSKEPRGRGPVKLGGTHFDITKWSRSERARYAFDRKDPLQHVPLKVLKEGTLYIE